MTAKRAKPRLPSYVSAPANDNYPPHPDDAVPATPTPERLAMAGEHVIHTAGTIRLVDRTFDRLHRAGELDPDPKRNNVLHIAGEQYLADYYNGGLAPLGSVDYSRPPVDGKSPKSDSSFREGARERWSRARKAMGRSAPAVDYIVLHNGAGDVVALRAGLAVLVERYDLERKR